MRLKEHLHKSKLSSNAVVLLLSIMLEEKQGHLEASYEDLMRGLGWSRSTLQRTVTELTQKGYIRITAAANGKSKTLIAVLVKFDGEDSAQVRIDLTGNESKAAPVKSDLGNSTPVVAHVRIDLSGNSTQVKNDSSAVPTTPPVRKEPRPPRNGAATPLPPRKNPNLFAGKLTEVQGRAVMHMGFDCDVSHISKGFAAVLLKFGNQQPMPMPGRLSTQVLNECLKHQRTLKAMGRDPDLFRWPAGLQSHASRLRNQERIVGRVMRKAA